MKKSAFENMVEKAFLGLEARYGLKKTETKYVDRGVIVRYQNASTELALNYEIGNTPWLEIADIKHAGNKSTLGWLLVEKDVEKPPTPEQAFQPTPLGEKDLAGVLQKMAQQVQKYGGDLLKGDFTLLPKLSERAKNYELECKHYSSIRKPKK